MVASPSSTHNPVLHDPDVQLMLQVRDHDDAVAFEQLMRQYQNRLLTVLEHLVGRRDQAEDLAQDVFLRVYRAASDTCPEPSFPRGCIQSPTTQPPTPCGAGPGGARSTWPSKETIRPAC